MAVVPDGVDVLAASIRRRGDASTLGLDRRGTLEEGKCSLLHHLQVGMSGLREVRGVGILSETRNNCFDGTHL